MTLQYPAPSYAGHIWIAGDQIKLGLPSTSQHQGHTLSLPATQLGVEAILQILRERAREEAILTIGTKAAPIQYDIEKMLKEIKKVPPVKKQDAPEDLRLEDLDV